MKCANNIKSVSDLKNNALKTAGETVALLKVLALAKEDALAGKGLSADDFLKELDAMDEAAEEVYHNV